MVSCVVQQDSAAPVMRLYKDGVDDCPSMHEFIVGESEKLSIAVDVATADADFNFGDTVKALADKKHKFAECLLAAYEVFVCLQDDKMLKEKIMLLVRLSAWGLRLSCVRLGLLRGLLRGLAYGSYGGLGFGSPLFPAVRRASWPSLKASTFSASPLALASTRR